MNESDLKRGSILCCKLRIFEHTGIYVGNGMVVELHGSGVIRLVNFHQFVRQGRQIYVACHPQDGELADESTAQNAEAQIGKRWGYHLVQNNCHRFTYGCLSENFRSQVNLFWKLEEGIRQKYQLNTAIYWRPLFKHR